MLFQRLGRIIERDFRNYREAVSNGNYFKSSHLKNKASQSPDVSFCIVGLPLHHFGTHIARHGDDSDCFFQSVLQDLRRPKGSDFQIPLMIEINVPSCDQPMNDMFAMYILQTH